MTAHVQSASKPGSRLGRLAVAAVAAFAAAVLAVGVFAAPAMAAITPTYDENTRTATVNATKDYTVNQSEVITWKSDVDYAAAEFTRSDKYVFTNNTKYAVTLWATGQVTKGDYKNIKWNYKIPEHTKDWYFASSGTGVDKVFTVDTLMPGETAYFYAYDSTFGASASVTMNMWYKSKPNTLINLQEKPELKVTKLASNAAAVRVKLPQAQADVKGVTQVKVYAGTKVIKTFTSRGGLTRDADGYYKFRYTKSGAGTAKYKAVATTIAKPSDTATSASVKPAANKATLKVSKKLSDYSKATTVISSLSYSGGKLVVKGYTVNPYGMKLPNFARSIYIVHNYNNTQINDRKMMAFPAGMKSFTLKYTTKAVIDLNDRQDYLVGSQPPVFA